MDQEYYCEVEFEGLDRLEADEFEACTFRNCNWSEQDLKRKKFIECEFIDCNLSNAKLLASSIQDCHFKDCKMLGLRFDLCNTFSFGFHASNCQLSNSNFYQLDLRNCRFEHCNLQEVDFSAANLEGVSLSGSNLSGVTFDESNLQKANLRLCSNLQIDPNRNQMSQATLSASALAGLVAKYKLQIHPNE